MSRGLLHREHPWIGRDVKDTATGRRGTLRALEWTTDPGSLADPDPTTPDTAAP